MKDFNKDAYKLAWELSKDKQFPVGHAATLIKLAKKHARFTEALCDRGGTYVEVRLQCCEDAIRAVVANVPNVIRGVTFSGDPRGYTVHLKLKGNRFNTLGGQEAGWGI
jgi:hypothetical protein